MILEENAITTMAMEGRMSLQVPEYSVKLMPTVDGMETLSVQYRPKEYPDSWFQRLAFKGPKLVLATKKHHNQFLYLSQEGWKQNKEAIRKAFDAALLKDGARPNHSWMNFEALVSEHFSQLAKTGCSGVSI